MNGLLSFLDLIITILGVITIVYQVGIVIVGMLVKPQTFRDVPQNRRYAVLISARNEEAVIGNLIRSIHNQTYPQELIDTWIVADNSQIIQHSLRAVWAVMLLSALTRRRWVKATLCNICCAR